ncbi:MAG: ABC transporter permease [Candidatus Woesearchaeota archaeon]
MLRDYFKLAWENITHRRLRSWLTIIGIVIGIAAVVALISLGQGVKKVITDEFAKAGTDKIYIQPGNGFNSYSKGIMPLTERDAEIVQRTKGVKEVAGMLMKGGRIEYNKDLYFLSILGMPLDETKKLLDEAWNLEYIDGRSLKSGDKYKAVIGSEVAKGKLLGKSVSVGDSIKIEGIEFRVIGELKSMGDPGIDGSIFIPKEVAQEIFNVNKPTGHEESLIVARTEIGEDPAAVAENIKKELRRYRDLKEGEEDFTVQTTEQLLDSFNTILNVLTAIVIGIAGISLFVGGVGIMNTMYTAVLQRTNEIGVMKAIGAKNSHILTIFIIESGMLGLIGGLIGLIIGMGLSSLIAFIGRAFLGTNLLYAYFPVYLIIGALSFAVIVGGLSGILPAIQASRQNPVDALRYE